MAWEINNGRAALGAAEKANEAAREAKEISDELQLKLPIIDDANAKSDEALNTSLESKTIAQNANTKSDQAITTANNIIAQSGDSNTEIVNGRQRNDGSMMPTIGDSIRLNESNITQVQDQLKESERESVALQHGVSVVNGSVSSPVDVEISGRTLTNLIYTESPFDITLETDKYYVLVNDDGSNITVNGSPRAVPYKFTGTTTTNITWLTGNPSLYEVSADEYSKILVDLDKSEVEKRYPRVEGTQHLTNPVVFSEGGNLIPPFTEWTLHANATIISPYEIYITPTATSQTSYCELSVSPNTDYSVNIEGGFYTVTNVEGSSIGLLPYGTGTRSFNSRLNERIRFYIRNNNIGVTETYSNPVMILGNTIRPFTPRNPSYLFTSVKLGQIGNNKDILYKQDGQWLVRKVIEKDVLLDGSLAWSFHANTLGNKRVVTPITTPAPILNTPRLFSRYDGSLIDKPVIGTANVLNDGEYNVSTINVVIAVSNNRTGFLETYTPTANELKAYFNGWQVKTTDGTGKPTAWKSIVDGTDAPTQTLTYVSTNMATNYTPYKLSYVLATPQIINVSDKVEGDIYVNGLTQVEVTSGVIVREKANPIMRGDSYQINRINAIGSELANKASKILSIYRNGLQDNNWIKVSDDNAYGLERLGIPSSLYDPTAEYTVTYLVLDRYSMTVNATEVKATYANDIRSALDDVVTKQSDIATELSVHERAIVDLYIRVKALEGS